MALSTSQSHPQSSLLDILTAPFKYIGNTLIRIGEANYRVRQVEFLQSLSDEELVKRGLRREDIMRRVFSDFSGA